jgi:hypothetical protein
MIIEIAADTSVIVTRRRTTVTFLRRTPLRWRARTINGHGLPDTIQLLDICRIIYVLLRHSTQRYEQRAGMWKQESG